MHALPCSASNEVLLPAVICARRVHRRHRALCAAFRLLLLLLLLLQCHQLQLRVLGPGGCSHLQLQMQQQSAC